MNTKLSVLRRIFLNIFILSSLAVLGLYLLPWIWKLMLLVIKAFGLPAELEINSVVILTSALTSLVALLGFLVTSFLSFRREKREAREAELTLKQKEIELEKARLELEQLKKQIEKKKK